MVGIPVDTARAPKKVHMLRAGSAEVAGEAGHSSFMVMDEPARTKSHRGETHPFLPQQTTGCSRQKGLSSDSGSSQYQS